MSSTLALGIAATALALSTGSWLLYLAAMGAGRVPATPRRDPGAQALAITAGIVSVAMSPASWPTLALGGSAIASGLVFFWLYGQRKTPVGDLRVAVGDHLLPFRSTTSEGSPFDSNSLEGRRVLLKFFRGHW